MSRRGGDPGTPRISLLGDVLTPLVAVAIPELGWRASRIAATDARSIRREAGGRIVSTERFLDRPDAEVVIVGSSVADRVDHAIHLLDHGVHVVVAAGFVDADQADRLRAAAERSTAALLIGDSFPTAPAVQRWFAELALLGEVGHLSADFTGTFFSRFGDNVEHGGEADVDNGDAEPPRAIGADADRGDPFAWSMIDCVRLTAGRCGWGHVMRVHSVSPDAVEFDFGAGRSFRIGTHRRTAHTPPRFELQAASARTTLRLTMLPSPELERNGETIQVTQPTPAVAFGVVPMLRTFWNDIVSGSPPVLDAAFGQRSFGLIEAISDHHRA